MANHGSGPDTGSAIHFRQRRCLRDRQMRSSASIVVNTEPRRALSPSNHHSHAESSLAAPAHITHPRPSLFASPPQRASRNTSATSTPASPSHGRSRRRRGERVDPPTYSTRLRDNMSSRPVPHLCHSSDNEHEHEHGLSSPESGSRVLSCVGPSTSPQGLSSRPVLVSDDPQEQDMSLLEDDMFSLKTSKIDASRWSHVKERLATPDSRDVKKILGDSDAIAVVQYERSKPISTANDIWPNRRDASKLPARYQPLAKDGAVLTTSYPGDTTSPNVNTKHTKAHAMSDFRGRATWGLPVELLELIADYLNREDVKALRLVSRELNSLVSQVLFKTVVVPFNTEIYGMLEREYKQNLKGKKRSRLHETGYSWQNTNGLDMYDGHGLDVFKGFGRHIQKFGMSFEVSEDFLANPPIKVPTAKQTSFWGDYDWPYEHYQRFEAVAGLETAADETPRMKVAFSELTKVRELALSIDNGLGWLNGPDRSIRARVLQRPPKVFSIPKDVPDRQTEAQQELWKYIETCHQEASKDVKHATISRIEGPRHVTNSSVGPTFISGLTMPHVDQRLINEAPPTSLGDTEPDLPANFQDPEVLEHFILAPANSDSGILFTSTTLSANNRQVMSPVIPAVLTKSQKEWLLETDWAQRAFMASYILSIVDNALTFQQVHSLTISRVSDCYLNMLDRSDFWDALPNLSHLTLMAIPSWRTVHKDEAGFVETQAINPTSSLDAYCALLEKQIARRENIRNLVFGWIGGGEHAEGLHARNRNLIPAPIMRLTFNGSETMTETNTMRLEAAVLKFPYIERMTLSNCWITPPALITFIKHHDAYRLQNMVFDSVSLTAILRPVADAAPNLGVAQPVVLGPGAQLMGAGGFFTVLNATLGAHPVNQNLNVLAQNNHNQVMQLLIQAGMAQLQLLLVNATTNQHQNQITAVQNQLQQLNHQLQVQNQAHFVAQLQPAQMQALVHPQQANIGAMINQVQQLGQQIAAQVAVVANQAAPPAATNSTSISQNILKEPARNGSWLNIIDIISPGHNLSDFDSMHSQADPARTTSLRSLEFVSCGYARLTHATNIDRTAIDPDQFLTRELRDPVLTRRATALAPVMLYSKWPQLGEIVQHVNFAELQALEVGWDLQTGWECAEEARSVEFDGWLAGGTGRFSGVIKREDKRIAEGDEE